MSDKVRRVVSHKKVLVIVLVVIVVTAVVLGFLLFSHQEFFNGLYWGMSMRQVERAEEGDGVEYNGTYIVQNRAFFEHDCNVLYDFDDNDKLTAVSFMPTSRDYQDYFSLFFLLYHEYGLPYYAEENLTSDASSVLPSQIIKWKESDTEILFGYMGESDYSDCNITITFQQKDSDEIKESNIAFSAGYRQCSSGQAIGGCNNTALPWSRNCEKHNCNIIGCDGYPWSDELNGVPLCSTHFMAALNDVIYVGCIDSDTRQQIEETYGVIIK